MPLEDLTGVVFVDALNPLWPLGRPDPKSEGDDHIRGIKNVLANTFPQATAPQAGVPTVSNGAAQQLLRINAAGDAAAWSAERWAVGADVDMGALTTIDIDLDEAGAEYLFIFDNMRFGGSQGSGDQMYVDLWDGTQWRSALGDGAYWGGYYGVDRNGPRSGTSVAYRYAQAFPWSVYTNSPSVTNHLVVRVLNARTAGGPTGLYCESLFYSDVGGAAESVATARYHASQPGDDSRVRFAPFYGTPWATGSRLRMYVQRGGPVG